ncbi:hypothetical protein BpHYR1_040685 [Brachionus plicatilis]|uniref:Uncharacterized protein n=1 Tax=Brachionus plicatilis TaxID=10195 RepID=A0A3M7PVU3_BRAPC|nr:hypothetical protein BpHYR1_040685 [Brachionus plicatilis]
MINVTKKTKTISPRCNPLLLKCSLKSMLKIQFDLVLVNSKFKQKNQEENHEIFNYKIKKKPQANTIK